MQPEIDPVRQAALALHALPEADCQRVLGLLTPEHQALLAPLLLELKQLGIPTSAGQAYLQADPPADEAASRLWTLTAQAALQVLQRQKTDVVARIWCAHPWPWRQSVLEGWPTKQRHDLMAAINMVRSSTASPLLERQLILAMADAMND